MRRFLEFQGQNIGVDYDREHANFFVKVEPHPFVVRKPATEVDTHNGNDTEPARTHRC